MSTTETATPSWFVQILFGRYRSLGNIQWTHLAVLGAIGFVMLYLYLFFLRRKFNHYSKAIAKLPRSLPRLHAFKAARLRSASTKRVFISRSQLLSFASNSIRQT